MLPNVRKRPASAVRGMTDTRQEQPLALMLMPGISCLERSGPANGGGHNKLDWKNS